MAALSSRRLYKSITVAKYSLPWSVGISVMSPTQRQFGAGAVKSRFNRSGNFGAVRSCRVSPFRRLIRLASGFHGWGVLGTVKVLLAWENRAV